MPSSKSYIFRDNQKILDALNNNLSEKELLILDKEKEIKELELLNQQIQTQLNKALTQPLKHTGFYRPLRQKQGIAEAGSWEWSADAGQSNFATVTGEAAGNYYNSSLNDNDVYKWEDIFLTKGNYKVTIIHLLNTNSGIAELLFDTTSLGTKDTYAGVITYNQINEIYFTLDTDTTADLRLKCSGKNGASSNYCIDFSRIWIEEVH